MKHLILGNGPAGVIAAEILRKGDKSCEIVLAGAEPEPAYSRMAIPYLLEEMIGEAGTHLRKDKGYFDSLCVTQKVGRATAVDTDAKTVTFGDGSTESYDKLLIATGSHPNRPPIPGIDLPQVQTCWTLEDARAITARAKPGARVVQVGAGFIGCIILESLKSRGIDLTVVELGDRMVPRMMTPVAGAMIKDWVEDKGIRVVTSAKVEKIEPAGGASAAPAAAPKPAEKKGLLRSVLDSISGSDAAPAAAAAPAPAASGDGSVVVTLSTGEQIPADLVIMSAGVSPNIDFLKGTAIKTGAGVSCDLHMRTSVPDVYAAGDVVEAPDLFEGAPMVSAIQPNAVDQGRVAALNMLGRNVELPGVLAINVLDTVGLISSSFGQWEGVEGGDSVELSDPERHHYLSLQFDGDVLVGATSIGLTQHVGVLRGLIQGQTPLGPWKEKLMDEPLMVTEAYLACAQKPAALVG